MSHPFEFLHEGLKHGEWTLLQRFPKTEGGDGQDAEVYVCAMPARFYKVVGLPSTNSDGDPVAPFTISTGSGDAMRKLSLAIAEAATDAMIEVRVPVAPADPEKVLEVVGAIALDKLSLNTLATRNSDDLDFHDLAVWDVRDALLAAFAAGRKSVLPE